jgi:hypothetical protein
MRENETIGSDFTIRRLSALIIFSRFSLGHVADAVQAVIE